MFLKFSRLLLMGAVLLWLSGCSSMGLKSGDNGGFTHGAAVVGGSAATSLLVDSWLDDPEQEVAADLIISAFALGTANHFYQRELDARGGLPFDEWDEDYGSRDSQYDGGVPILSALAVLWWRWTREQ